MKKFGTTECQQAWKCGLVHAVLVACNRILGYCPFTRKIFGPVWCPKEFRQIWSLCMLLLRDQLVHQPLGKLQVIQANQPVAKHCRAVNNYLLYHPKYLVGQDSCIIWVYWRSQLNDSMYFLEAIDIKVLIKVWLVLGH